MSKRLGWRFWTMTVLALSASGCDVVEHPPQVRGQQVQADQLKELVPGTATQADVTSLLGTPTAHATFDNNSWLYIFEVTRPRVGSLPGVEDQQVVTLHFDQGGILRSIEKRGPDDAKSVSMNDRITPSPGSNASFTQQLFGNIGRYSPGGLLGSAMSGNSMPGGGVPNHN